MRRRCDESRLDPAAAPGSPRQPTRRVSLNSADAAVSLDLAVAQFDGEGTAVQRYAAVKERSRADPAWMHQVGFVERHHNGRLLLRGTFAGHYVDVDESDHVSQGGTSEGAVAGGLVGVLLGPPGIAVGLALGGVIGSQAGDSTEIEAEPEALAAQLRAVVPRSSSAVVLIAPAPDVDEMFAALGEAAQGVVRRTLAADQAAELEASLGTAPPASPER
jgi:uncharacterized membrane protein